MFDIFYPISPTKLLKTPCKKVRLGARAKAALKAKIKVVSTRPPLGLDLLFGSHTTIGMDAMQKVWEKAKT